MVAVVVVWVVAVDALLFCLASEAVPLWFFLVARGCSFIPPDWEGTGGGRTVFRCCAAPGGVASAEGMPDGEDGAGCTKTWDLVPGMPGKGGIGAIPGSADGTLKGLRGPTVPPGRNIGRLFRMSTFC